MNLEVVDEPSHPPHPANRFLGPASLSPALHAALQHHDAVTHLADEVFVVECDLPVDLRPQIPLDVAVAPAHDRLLSLGLLIRDRSVGRQRLLCFRGSPIEAAPPSPGCGWSPCLIEVGPAPVSCPLPDRLIPLPRWHGIIKGAG